MIEHAAGAPRMTGTVLVIDQQWASRPTSYHQVAHPGRVRLGTRVAAMHVWARLAAIGGVRTNYGWALACPVRGEATGLAIALAMP